MKTMTKKENAREEFHWERGLARIRFSGCRACVGEDPVRPRAREIQ